MAAKDGNAHIVRVLLNVNAGVYAKSVLHGCPLGAPATKKSIEIVHMQLSCDVCVNILDGCHSCQLSAAAAYYYV
jgi:hypothetical protein